MIFRYILAQIAPWEGANETKPGAYKGQGGGDAPEGGILGGMPQPKNFGLFTARKTPRCNLALEFSF